MYNIKLKGGFKLWVYLEDAEIIMTAVGFGY